MELQLPSSLTEGEGTITNGGTLSLSASTTTDINVLLTSSDSGELEVPGFVIIPAGANQVAFDVSVIDDAEMDGTTDVSVLAQAPGYIPANANVTVVDNDLHHFLVEGVTNVSLFGSANITISAVSIDDTLIDGFAESISLTASGDRGDVVITPATLTNMVGGTVSATVSFESIGTDVTLTATAGDITGTSALFNVEGSQLVLTPASLNNTLVVAGESLVRTMVISNAGNVDLEYEIEDVRDDVEVPIENLVLNGDFESGNTNFTSGYVYTSEGSYAQGIYTVGDDPTSWFSTISEMMTDHTSGSGQMLIANANSSGSDVVWQQDIDVTAGASYELSLWVAGLQGGVLPSFDIQVAGSSIGSVSPSEMSVWTEFTNRWTATESGTVTLSINNTQHYPAFVGGLYFTLDDIELVQVGVEGEASDSGPVAYYPFNGNASDESGNGYDGTVTGATLTADRFGHSASAYDFNGTSAHIEVPHTDALSLDGVFSMSLWMKTSEANANSGLITKVNDARDGYLLGVGNDESAFLTVLNDFPDTKGRIDTTNSVIDGVWHHLVAVYDGDTMSMYLDGSLSAELAYTNGLTPNVSSMYIGWDPYSSDRHFDGVMDEVRIYSRALSATEVEELYTESDSAAVSDLEAGLVASYAFDGDASDESGNGYDGTVTGATLTTNRFGDVDGAYYFDGIDDRIDLPSETLNFERTNAFSQSLWIKTSDDDAGNIILAKMASDSSYRGWCLAMKNGLLSTYLINNGTTQNRLRVDGTTLINDDQWHHLVVTYDGSSMASGVAVYIDGSLENSVIVADTLSGTILNSVTPTIGSRSSESYYEGSIDDIRIYSRTLSAAEVEELYTESDSAGSEEPAVESAAVYYAFDGDATDESGNGNDGIVEGATLMEDRFGNPDQAFRFDVGNYIRTANGAGSADITGVITMAAWINPEQLVTKSSDPGILRTILRKKSQYDSYGYSLSVRQTGELVAAFGDSSDSSASQVADNMDPLTTNEWSHVAVTYDGSQIRYYVNGVLVDTQAYTKSLLSTTEALCIGRLTDSDSRAYFYGGIDEVYLFDRVLTESEVQSLYTGGCDDGEEEDVSEDSGSWLSADPLTGTVPAGSNVTVSVTFDASGLVAGEQRVDLMMLMCNDQATPTVPVDASMYVVPAAPVMNAEPETTTGTSNSVSWRAVAGPVSYAVEVATVTNATALQESGWMTATNYTFSALETNVTYYYRVQASVDSDMGQLSGPWSGWVWSTQSATAVDADGDGIPDGWETQYFGEAGVVNPDGDSDGDGQSDYDEYVAGMDPTSSASCFMVNEAYAPTNGQFVIYWVAVTGRVYSIEWASAVTNSFEPMATDLYYPQNSYTDTLHQAEDSGFYKVEVEFE
jgi:hypothetical protein